MKKIVFDAQLFNKDDERQYAEVYLLLYRAIMKHCKKQVKGNEQCKETVDIAFKMLRGLKKKEFTSLTQIEKFLKNQVDESISCEKRIYDRLFNKPKPTQSHEGD